MARVARLAGAIVAETDGAFYLIGHPKVPCDWAAGGIEPPGAIDARVTPFLRLRASSVELAAPRLVLSTEGEALAQLLARRLLIARTGSVSERLWRLCVGESDELAAQIPAEVDARWLTGVPDAIWDVVREAVLRCS
jgi:hypothetical protein